MIPAIRVKRIGDAFNVRDVEFFRNSWMTIQSPLNLP